MKAGRVRRPGSIALLILLSVGVFLIASVRMFRLGFPLDDAWIHQTYARSLVETGQWAFSPGDASAGSTAPLWTILLTPAYMAGITPLVWVTALACIQLGLAAWLGMRWFSLRGGKRTLWIGLLVASEWHLLWAGLSGMETLLMGLVALLMMLLLDERKVSAFWLGVLLGAAVWVRPDAVTLLLPIGWTFICHYRSKPGKLAAEVLKVTAGAALLFLPYLLFNFQLSGEWWPTTFYAKQAEYAALQGIPVLERLTNQLMLPLVGIGLLLVPGILRGAYIYYRERSWQKYHALLWVLTYLNLYALRLPVQYQHGRYAMPVIPVLLVLGWEGLDAWVQPSSPRFLSRVLSRTWLMSVIAGAIAFLGLGARAYAKDVAIIESEMVETAAWIAQNLPGDALLAVHDIGAIGYFTENRLLDLAGLISPEVIPFIRDETKLADFLDTKGANYLVTFPGWYPTLSTQAELRFATGSSFSPMAGGENMAVFYWP